MPTHQRDNLVPAPLAVQQRHNDEQVPHVETVGRRVEAAVDALRAAPQLFEQLVLTGKDTRRAVCRECEDYKAN